MSRAETAPCLAAPAFAGDREPILSSRETIGRLDVCGPFGVDVERLPFSLYDTTAGCETELQAVVVGKKEQVDLPMMIGRSHYLANIVRRAAAGELPNRAMTGLERYLHENADEVWENSWVRFPSAMLGPLARLSETAPMFRTSSSSGRTANISGFRSAIS